MFLTGERVQTEEFKKKNIIMENKKYPVFFKDDSVNIEGNRANREEGKLI